MNALEKKIFEIKNESDFLSVSLEVFDFQYNNCKIYRDFVNNFKRKKPKTLEEIPFLPISFFKTHEIRSKIFEPKTLFLSSGTTGMERSHHWIESTEMYEQSFERIYRDQIGNPEDQIILALLPNYLEQGNSSLVYMVDKLIQLSKNPISGFYLNDLQALIKCCEVNKTKKIVLFGVSYALLDLADLKPNLSHVTIIETGGMKGRRKELTKNELHQILKNAFQVDSISSEYGMTELLSQSYSNKNGVFHCPNWMKIMIREINDPFHYIKDNKTGGINVIDLANLYSCSFIATQDLGKTHENTFQLMGRFDNSDVRGCNLMVE